MKQPNFHNYVALIVFLITNPILLIPFLMAASATGSEGTLRLDKVEVSMHMVLPAELQWACAEWSVTPFNDGRKVECPRFLPPEVKRILAGA